MTADCPGSCLPDWLDQDGAQDTPSSMGAIPLLVTGKKSEPEGEAQ